MKVLIIIQTEREKEKNENGEPRSPIGDNPNYICVNHSIYSLKIISYKASSSTSKNPINKL